VPVSKEPALKCALACRCRDEAPWALNPMPSRKTVACLCPLPPTCALTCALPCASDGPASAYGQNQCH
jgi:hypothetical protein